MRFGLITFLFGVVCLIIAYLTYTICFYDDNGELVQWKYKPTFLGLFTKRDGTQSCEYKNQPFIHNKFLNTSNNDLTSIGILCFIFGGIFALAGY